MRRRFREGAGMEEVGGYSRAVRHGDLIVVSGTGDLAGDGTIGHPGDTYGQERAAFERSLAAIGNLGGRREDVVRSRIYCTPESDRARCARTRTCSATSPPSTRP